MHIPLIEKLKSIPGAIGIRLEEELPYTVEKKMGELEIRSYRPFTLAQTSASGDFDHAKEVCFKRLAEFIFGENTKSEITEMTTPVFYDRKGDEWVMSFYLPDEVADLKPEDSAISIESKPGKIAAVYTFTGNFDLENMDDARTELLRLVSESGLMADSDVWWAQFDQPVSLPFTKRNEALVKVVPRS
jgi:hypothetical protein